MTDFEQSVLTQLGEIKSQGAATAEKVSSLDERLFNGGAGIIHILQADIEEVKTTALGAASVALKLDTRLFQEPTGTIIGLQAEIADIKASRESERKADRIQTAFQIAVAPILVGLHIIARRLGINI